MFPVNSPANPIPKIFSKMETKKENCLEQVHPPNAFFAMQAFPN